MKPAKPTPARDANEEIAALIETLHRTGQRLEELTAGEVDTVADRDGRTFLLRHAQEQLRHSEAAKQAAILNALPAHIAMLDSQGRIVSVNAAWREFAAANGLQGPKYGIGVNYLAICDSALGADAAEARQAAAGIRSVLSAGATSFSLEYPCHSPSAKRWFLMNVIPLAADHLHGAVVVHLNITERKQSEQKLRESETELRAIFDGALDGILATDKQTKRILTANAEICSMLGYSRAEILRLGIGDIHPKQGLSLTTAHIERVVRGETQMAVNIPMQRKDGSVFYADVKASLIRLGGKDCLLALFRDVTERRRAAQELLESELRFRQIAENIRDVFFLRDAVNDRVLYVSPAYDEIWGRSRESLYANPQAWSDAIHPDDRAATAENYRNGMSIGKFELEYRIVRPDGSMRWIESRGFPVCDDAGKVVRIAGIAKDITQQKHDAQKILAAQDQLQATLDAIPDLLFELGLDGRYHAYHSPRIELLAAPAESLLGRTVAAVLPADAADVVLSALREANDKGRSNGKQLQLQLPQGRLWFELSVSRKGTAPGEEPRFICLSRDITERKLAEQALQTSESEQRQLAEELQIERRRLVAAQQVAKIGSWETDTATLSVIWSDQTHRIFETDPATFCPTHQAFLELIHPDDRAKVEEAFERSVNQRVAGVIDHRVLLPDGRIKFVEERWQLICDEQGKPVRASGTCQDITERKEAQDKIVQLNRIHAMLSGINTLIVRVPNRDELFKEACRIAVEAGGFRMSLIAILDRSTMKIVPVASAGKDDGLMTAIQDILSSSAHAPSTLVARAIREKVTIVSNDSQSDPEVLFGKNYSDSGVRSMAVLPLIVAEEALGVLALYAGEREFFHAEELKLLTELAGDIAFAMDHLDKQERLNYLAYYDVLTGLPNRSLLYDRLAQGVSLARRNQWLLAVLFVDLDNFKTVNDTLGHTIGDALLQEVARRLAACLRDADTVGRLGGDEFGILLSEIGNSEAAAMVARKVIESCRQAYLIEGHELFISASIGIALFPDDAGDGDTLIRNADAAMYRAKELGRNNYQFFTAEMNQNTQDRLRLEADLRYALGKGQFLLHYQPKVSCSTGKVTGFEALLRWQHPQRGLVGPDQFIPALEDTGLIIAVGEWVLTSACAQAKSWQDAGLGILGMAVNISGHQIDAADLCETVGAALAASGLAPACLELELTESQLMKDAEGIIGLLRRLKTMGVHIAVDDFGTGYSSLAYLKRFPIDNLKVDRAFVRDIIADVNDVSITRAIITLAHNLKLKVVAEGVETEGQLGMLIANHCNEVQGYYFSRPLPAEEATALLRSGRTLDSRMLAGMRSNRTLLLVDDEANILSALKRLLRRDGYEILTALSAEQGLEMLASHPVDVIISDQRMPGMSGVEFLRRVKTLHPETVRLVLSGYTDLQAVTDAINEGAIYKFLTKPWDDGILRANIEEAFRHKEMADENRRMHAELTLANEQMTAVNAQLQELLTSKEQALRGKDQGRPQESRTGGSR